MARVSSSQWSCGQCLYYGCDSYQKINQFISIGSWWKHKQPKQSSLLFVVLPFLEVSLPSPSESGLVDRSVEKFYNYAPIWPENCIWITFVLSYEYAFSAVTVSCDESRRWLSRCTIAHCWKQPPTRASSKPRIL